MISPRFILAVLLSFLAGWAIASETVPRKQADLFLSFARDVSGDDPALMARAWSLVASPPTTKESIGFYGMEDAPATERAIRAIISELADAGHLITIEDKYVYELPRVLEAADALDTSAFSINPDIEAFFEDVDWDAGGPSDAQWVAFRDWFPAYARELEQAVEAHGKRLLSVSVPMGDTHYFWAATPEQSETWNDKPLYFGLNTVNIPRTAVVSLVVGSPDWGEVWESLVYAIRVPDQFSAKPDGL